MPPPPPTPDFPQHQMRPNMIDDPPPYRPPAPPLRCLADVPGAPTPWLWPGRIPRAALTLLVGDPGRGKSLLTLDIAARVTTGRPWPDELLAGAVCANRRADELAEVLTNEPGDVILLSAEDSLARTVRSRLAGLGADLRRVHYLNAGLWKDGSDADPRRQPDRIDSPTTFGYVPPRAYDALRHDAHNLQQAVASLSNCRLVVLDPIPAYLHAIDVTDPEQARTFLAPLCTLADESGAAIIAVAHRDLPTARRGDRRHHSLQALAAMARAIYVVDSHPDDSTRRTLTTVKNNLGAPPPTLSFEVTSHGGGDARLVWSETPENRYTGGALTDSPWNSSRPPGRVTELERAVEWLRTTLAAGPMLGTALAAAATHAGFSEMTLRRARGQLGVQYLRQKMSLGGQWFCILPSHSQENDLVDQTNTMSNKNNLNNLNNKVPPQVDDEFEAILQRVRADAAAQEQSLSRRAAG